MLTAQQIAGLRDAAAQITDPINEYLIRDIARRIAGAGRLTSTAAYQVWRMQQAGKSQREVERELRRMLEMSKKQIRKILHQSAQSGYELDISRFPTVAAIPFEKNAVLQQIVSTAVELAQEDFTNLTQTLGMVDPHGNALPLQDAYRSCTDFAFKQVVTGAASYTEAIRQTTRQLVAKGVRVIDYESGVHTGLEAAVRRNILGGLGLMQKKISQQVHDGLGCDGWEITAHADSAPDHEPVQGRQFPDAEYQALNNSLVRCIGTLNCGHAAFPIILGVNQPQYTPEELEKLRADNEEGVTVDGVHYTGYQATQMQRSIERAIRAQKRKVMVDEAAGDEEKLAQDKTRLEILRQRYAEFSKAAGLRTQEEWTEVAGFGEKSSGKLENPTESGILKAGGISGALDPDSARATEHAKRYYESVRKMTTDVGRIAANTGYAESEIQRIKNFIFMDEHDLGGGRISRFDASYEMAESWQRLIDGKNIQPHDVTLLRHEIMEKELMDAGYSQDEAHIITSMKHNYTKEAYEYYHGKTEGN